MRYAKLTLPVGMLALLLIAGTARAQYAELWSQPFPSVGGDLVLCGSGRTNAGSGPQMLYGVKDAGGPGFSGLRLLDGATGAITWSLTEPVGTSGGQLVIHDAGGPDLWRFNGYDTVYGPPGFQNPYGYPTGPALLDVDGDGYDEIVYLDGEPVPHSGVTLHVVKYTGPASVNPSSPAQPLSMEPPRPNPTQGGTTVDYALPTDTQVEADVYTVQGQLVRTLESGRRVAGRHSISWNATDAQGRPVSSGMYFVVVRSAGGEVSRRAVVIH